MLLIWGWRTRFRILANGMFHCPTCGGDRHFARKQARRWFTFFFLPLIPLKVLGEFVECQPCKKGYDERILRQPTSAALTEHLVGATREAAVCLLRIDDTPSGRAAAIVALSQMSGVTWSEEILAADLVNLDVSHLPERLRPLGEVMNEHGKEGFVASLATIAAGG